MISGRPEGPAIQLRKSGVKTDSARYRVRPFVVDEPGRGCGHLTPEGLTDSHAMPVGDFIAETVAIIRGGETREMMSSRSNHSATPKRPAITTPCSKRTTRYSGNKARRWAASCARDAATNDRSQRAGQRLLLAAKDRGDQGEPHQFCSQPSRNRHRSGPVSRCRRVGRCPWGTRRWR